MAQAGPCGHLPRAARRPVQAGRLGCRGQTRRCAGAAGQARCRAQLCTVCGVAELEHLHRARQALRLVAQALRGGGRLFHQRGVLLRHLVELVDSVIDLADPVRLLGCGRRDLADDVAHAVHRADDFVHGGAGVLHQARAGLHLLDRGADQLLDLARRLGAAPGQAAHFAGHHGKTPTLLARTRRFHGGVERQDVGLEGDAVDHADDVGNLAARRGDQCHGGHHVGYLFTALGCHQGRALGQLAGLLGRIRVLAHGGGLLLHGRCSLLQAGGRLLGATGQVVVGHGNFATGHLYPRDLFVHVSHQ